MTDITELTIDASTDVDTNLVEMIQNMDDSHQLTDTWIANSNNDSNDPLPEDYSDCIVKLSKMASNEVGIENFEITGGLITEIMESTNAKILNLRLCKMVDPNSFDLNPYHYYTLKHLNLYNDGNGNYSTALLKYIAKQLSKTNLKEDLEQLDLYIPEDKKKDVEEIFKEFKACVS